MAPGEEEASDKGQRRVREGSEKGQRRVREGSEKGGAGPGGTKEQGSRFCSHTLIQLIVVTP